MMFSNMMRVTDISPEIEMRTMRAARLQETDGAAGLVPEELHRVI